MSLAEGMADVGSWQEERLQNLCPACFAFDERLEDPGSQDAAVERSIYLSLDGNLQHIRFRDRHRWDFESFKPKMFVNYGRREYPTSINPIDNDTTCGSHFKATKGWSRTLKTTVTKKALDETGLVLATCYHGTPLRLLNMHGSGERHTHAEAILISIFQELKELGQINICYDVACVFEPAIQKLLPFYESRLKVRIGRFHVYAHGLSCQVLFSTLRTEGYGLMVGEEPEHNWYAMAPLI